MSFTFLEKSSVRTLAVVLGFAFAVLVVLYLGMHAKQVDAQCAGAGGGDPVGCAWNNGQFVGYANAWPPGCQYIIGGLPASQSGTLINGNLAFNASDRRGSTTAPICRSAPVPPWRVTYTERGHRMYQVGTFMDRNGCFNVFRADGVFLERKCQPVAGGPFCTTVRTFDGSIYDPNNLCATGAQGAQPGSPAASWPQGTLATDATTPRGNLDWVSKDGFGGWAYDPKNLNTAVDVHFYADGPAGAGRFIGSLHGTPGARHGDRPDVKTAFGLTGTGLYGFTMPLPVSLQDGRGHMIFAYTIDSTGTNNNPQLASSPKTLSATGTPVGGTGGGGGGASARHNYLSPCTSTGILANDEPAIAAVMNADGSITATIDTRGIPGAVTKINGQTVSGNSFTLKKGDIIVVTTGKGTYEADTADLQPGGSISVLIPMPCIRIGYNDIMGGQQCGENQSGTCADELDAFINVDNLLAAGLKAGDFEIRYMVKGGSTDTGGWKKYNWQNCGMYENHCIRLKGQGIVFAQTRIINTTGTFISGHSSLTAQMPFDTGIPRTQ